MGGTSFAVSGTVYQSSRAPWNMFDNNSSTFYDPASGSFNDVIFTIYNPTPLCITQIQYVVRGSYYQSKVIIQGSDDNSNWIDLGTYNLASGSTQTTNISNTQFFKYYKFTGTGYSMVGEVKLTATYATSTLNSIIFPTSYTSSNSYGASFSYIGGSSSTAYISTKSNTGLSLDGVDTNSSSANWIALGY